MTLIACPDCGKNVSDQARTCPYCGLPVVAYLQQMREEEEARIEEEEIERQRMEDQRAKLYVAMIVAGIIVIVLIGSCISNSQGQTPSTGRVLFELDNQKMNLMPGANVFSVNGKLKIEYSCQPNTKNTATVQFTLVDTNSSSTVWKQSVKCPISSPGTIQVKASTYDVGVSVSGDATWSMKVTQA